MNLFKIIMFFGAVLISSSCIGPSKKYCGYEMSPEEVNDISQWSVKYSNPYNIGNGSDIYYEINDSIRNNMPDSVDFELFLIKITEDEVCIDAYCPPNEGYYEVIACAMMRSNYSSIVPKQRKIRIYSYNNNDPSGDSPFEIAVKLLDQ